MMMMMMLCSNKTNKGHIRPKIEKDKSNTPGQSLKEPGKNTNGPVNFSTHSMAKHKYLHLS